MRRRHLMALGGMAAANPGLARAQKPEPRAAAPAAPQAGGALHLRRFEIMDPSGFERPVAALSLLAPAGWQLEGGIAWGYPTCLATDLVRLHARLASPDGQHALEFLPIMAWSWSDDPMLVQGMRMAQAQRQGCPAGQPMAAAEVARQLYLPRFRPQAQILGSQPDRAAAQAAREMVQPQLAMRPQAALQADAARVRLAVGDAEEWLAVAVTVLSYAVPSPAMAAQGGIGMTRQYDSAVQSAFAFRAPRGRLEQAEPLLGAMLASVRINPAWMAAVAQVMTNIGRVQLQGVMDRARIWRDAMNEIGEMRMQSWRTARDSQDRMSRAFSQYIRGVETRINPATGAPIEVPSGYRGVWVNGAGEVVLSNEPGFDPGRAMGGAWQALRPG